MYNKRGVQRVRGWKYTRSRALNQAVLDDIESNIQELFDLCRLCSKAGHFITQCREKQESDLMHLLDE